MVYLKVIVCLSNGMSDHYWSIMGGSAVMTNLRCEPDFPILHYLICQVDARTKEPKNQRTRSAKSSRTGGKVYVSAERMGHTKDEVYTQPFETRLRFREIQTRGENVMWKLAGAGLGDSR